MSNYFKQSLEKGEEPLLLLRQHAATFIWPIFRTVLMVGVSVPLLPYAFNYMWSTIAIIVWWVFVLSWFTVSWFTWYFNIALVTSHRLISINQPGIFTRRVRESTHDKIVEVTFQIKGPLATIFGYGNVDVYFTGQEKPITIKAVASPEIVKDQILKIKDFVVNSSQQADDSSLQKLADMIKEGQGEHKIPVRVNGKLNEKDGE